MKINTNRWNKIRYTLYTPGYDKVGKFFAPSRKKSIDALEIQAGEKVLLIGAGTGLDLEFIPRNSLITATDLTPAMVERIKKRNESLKLDVETLVMDGQKLTFPDATFDKIILHLILAVIPDPVACIKEAERVLKPAGRIAVFDKFASGDTLSLKRRLLNPIANFFFTDITRNIEKLTGETHLKMLAKTPANFNGKFVIVLLEK